MLRFSFHKKFIILIFLPFFHELIEVFFHILKDKVEVVIFSDDFLQFHHIGMIQLLQWLFGKHICESFQLIFKGDQCDLDCKTITSVVQAK